jgi:glycosyltransferase involved in cell wall biosynthesis
MLGKPLLMIKNTGLDGLVNEYEIGEVAESISGTDIKKALDTLIACHDRWGGMSSRAVQLYKTRFNWDSMKKVLLEAYKEL